MLKVKAVNWFISIGQLAEAIGVDVAKVRATAEAIGVSEFDLQIGHVGHFNGTTCAKIIRAIAAADGDVEFPGHPVLLGEIQRLAAETKARADA